MEHHPIDSSMFESAGYSAETQTLELKFKATGATYSYHGVSPQEYQSFLTAKSKGNHFNLHLRGKRLARKAE